MHDHRKPPFGIPLTQDLLHGRILLDGMDDQGQLRLPGGLYMDQKIAHLRIPRSRGKKRVQPHLAYAHHLGVGGMGDKVLHLHVGFPIRPVWVSAYGAEDVVHLLRFL